MSTSTKSKRAASSKGEKVFSSDDENEKMEESDSDDSSSEKFRQKILQMQKERKKKRDAKKPTLSKRQRNSLLLKSRRQQLREELKKLADSESESDGEGSGETSVAESEYEDNNEQDVYTSNDNWDDWYGDWNKGSSTKSRKKSPSEDSESEEALTKELILSKPTGSWKHKFTQSGGGPNFRKIAKYSEILLQSFNESRKSWEQMWHHALQEDEKCLHQALQGDSKLLASHTDLKGVPQALIEAWKLRGSEFIRSVISKIWGNQMKQELVACGANGWTELNRMAKACKLLKDESEANRLLLEQVNVPKSFDSLMDLNLSTEKERIAAQITTATVAVSLGGVLSAASSNDSVKVLQDQSLFASPISGPDKLRTELLHRLKIIDLEEGRNKLKNVTLYPYPRKIACCKIM